MAERENSRCKITKNVIRKRIVTEKFGDLSIKLYFCARKDFLLLNKSAYIHYEKYCFICFGNSIVAHSMYR